MTKSKTGAMRDNKGKLPFSWVPYEVLEAMSSVLWHSSKEGGGKYEKHNWQKGAEHSVPMNSLLRHSFKRNRGEMKDSESGLPHSWHILTNAAFLVYYEAYNSELNDLIKESNEKTTDRKTKRKLSRSKKSKKTCRRKKSRI